jgi:hypothetical protein
VTAASGKTAQSLLELPEDVNALLHTKMTMEEKRFGPLSRKAKKKSAGITRSQSESESTKALLSKTKMAIGSSPTLSVKVTMLESNKVVYDQAFWRSGRLNAKKNRSKSTMALSKTKMAIGSLHTKALSAAMTAVGTGNKNAKNNLGDSTKAS